MYYDSTRPFVDLASTDFGAYLQVLFGDNTVETKSLFTSETGVPYSYMYFNDKTCMVLRLTSVILLMGFKSITVNGPRRMVQLCRSWKPKLEQKLKRMVSLQNTMVRLPGK